MATSGHICVDLDGTLALYDHWKGIDHVGDPIPAMLKRVKDWLAAGTTVKIFTARVSVPDRDKAAVIAPIHAWCEKHGLPPLEVTCMKDFSCVRIYDDRAVQVEMNTGRIIGEMVPA